MSNGSVQGQTYLSLQGGELQGNVEMNGNKITGLGEAVDDRDAVRLGQTKKLVEDNSFFGQFKLGAVLNTVNAVTRINFEKVPRMILIKFKLTSSSSDALIGCRDNSGSTVGQVYLGKTGLAKQELSILLPFTMCNNIYNEYLQNGLTYGMSSKYNFVVIHDSLGIYSNCVVNNATAVPVSIYYLP